MDSRSLTIVLATLCVGMVSDIKNATTATVIRETDPAEFMPAHRAYVRSVKPRFWLQISPYMSYGHSLCYTVSIRLPPGIGHVLVLDDLGFAFRTSLRVLLDVFCRCLLFQWLFGQSRLVRLARLFNMPGHLALDALLEPARTARQDISINVDLARLASGRDTPVEVQGAGHRTSKFCLKVPSSLISLTLLP